MGIPKRPKKITRKSITIDETVLSEIDTSSPGLSEPQKRLLEGAEAAASGDFLIQPMQSVALSPKNGAITKRMMLSWLYFLKQIQEMEPATTYRFRMAPLMEFLESREYEDIKEDLRSLNGTQVEWNNYRNDETSWGVSTLLSQVEIKSSKNGNFIEISLPPKIESGIRERKGYSELNLLLARQLRSTAALNLYRICVAYETNPSGVTFRAQPADWYPKLAGNPMPEGSKFEYKYFKRDTLHPAIAEINTLSDILVDLIEHREGKRVKELQFSVKPKPQGALDLRDGDSEETKLLTELIQLGVRRNNALTLLKQYGAKRIERNIEYTKQRQKTLGDAMRNPVLYLKKAIREDYAVDASADDLSAENLDDPRTAQEKAGQEREKSLRAEFDTYRRSLAADMFKEMPKAQSIETWEIYIERLRVKMNSVLLKQAETKGLKSKHVEVDFLDWLAHKNWGEPTEKELLQYVLRKSK